MATRRRVVRAGRRAVIEEIDNRGQLAWFVRCQDRILNQGFDGRGDADLWFEAVERGTARPPF